MSDGASHSMAGLTRRLGLHDKAAAISVAKAAEHAWRGGSRSSPQELASLRWATLRALETYAADLESLGWPVPRQVSQDIRLRCALLRVSTRARRVAP